MAFIKGLSKVENLCQLRIIKINLQRYTIAIPELFDASSQPLDSLIYMTEKSSVLESRRILLSHLLAVANITGLFLKNIV